MASKIRVSEIVVPGKAATSFAGKRLLNNWWNEVRSSRRFELWLIPKCYLYVGTHKRFAPNIFVHSLITSQIGFLLRQRVLQEFEILAEAVQRRPRGAKENSVLRRLTREEFKRLRATGVISYPEAIAVIVVPPLNRNPVTKERPVPTSSLDNSMPKEQDQIVPSRPPLPLSTMLPLNEPDDLDDVDYDLPYNARAKI